MSNWYPQFRQGADPQLQDALQKAFDFLYELRGAVTELRAQKADANLLRGITPEAIRRELQAGGRAPLNIQNLIGQAAEPQFAYVPDAGIGLPDRIADPESQNRLFIVRNGQLYIFDASTQPGTWVPVGTAGAMLQDTHANRLALPQYAAASLAEGTLFWETDRTVLYQVNGGVWKWRLGTMRGTFNPNQRPADLGAADAGFLFYATDATVTWRWDGTVWKYLSGRMQDTLTPDNRPVLGVNDIYFEFHATDDGYLFFWDGSAWQEFNIVSGFTVFDQKVGGSTTLTVKAGDTQGTNFWQAWKNNLNAVKARILYSGALILDLIGGAAGFPTLRLKASETSGIPGSVTFFDPFDGTGYGTIGGVNVSEFNYDAPVPHRFSTSMVRGTIGFRSDQALYPKTLAAAPTNPDAGYGGLGHKATSTYWYWDGAAWQSVDFAAAGISSKVGTHATRLITAPGPAGSFFWETDRTVLYQSQGGNWVYVGGRYNAGQASIPVDLGANDVGFLMNVTDYAHVLSWSGLAWGWGPGEQGSGMIVLFTLAPTSAGWQICDGTAGVGRLNADGTVTNVTVPNLIGSPTFLRAASAYTGTVVAASAPGLSGSSAGGTAHGHGVGTLANSSDSAGTPAGTVSTPTFTGNAMGTHDHDSPIQVSGANLTTLSMGVGASYSTLGVFTGTTLSTTATATKVSATSAGTPTGTISTPTFTGSALAGHTHTITGSTTTETSHTHPVGTYAVDATALPRHLDVLPYFRR